MPSFWALPTAGIRRNKMTASTFALRFIFHLPIYIACNSIPSQRMVGGNGPPGHWYIKRYESRMGTVDVRRYARRKVGALLAMPGRLRHATARWREGF